MYMIRYILDRREYITLINNIVKMNHQFLKIFRDYMRLRIKYMQMLQICIKLLIKILFSMQIFLAHVFFSVWSKDTLYLNSTIS